ncbi:MAG: hypothetical protein JKY48_17645 [Flavobacteriales bacterium]|nr:hypothetical protein [Flavobacteriales bacterium]
MKKLIAAFMITGFLFTISSCEKDEDTSPDTTGTTTPTDTSGNGGSGGGTGGDTTVVVANVGDLLQNHIKADGRSEDFLYITSIGGFTSGNDDYFTLHITGENNHYIDLTIKGSELKEGNFSLKKYRLGSTPAAGVAVMHVSIGGNLLDFESTDNKSISIKKDENGFFVIKMAPIVGINRNSWDQVITEAISVHVVTNHTKIITSNTAGDTFKNDLYDFRARFHNSSNQATTELNVNPVSISFSDYDFSNQTSIAKMNYTLSSSGISSTDAFNGTAPMGVHMSYQVNWNFWKQNYSKTQTIEMELTPKTIIIRFVDIEFVNPSDPTQTRTASGQWELAR